MHKITQRIKPASRHFKNSGEVTYIISPLKDRIPASLMPDNVRQTPEGQYISIREKTIAICKPLYVEDFVPRFGSFKSIKWHLVHATWLFEKTILRRYIKKYCPFHDKFDRFFEAIEDLENGDDFSRPSLDSIISYRNHIDQQMISFLNSYPKKHEEEITYYLQFILGLEMDSQEEILTQVKARFFDSELRTNYWPADEDNGPTSRTTLSPLKWIDFSGGLVNVGASGSQFACDMEMPRHTIYIRPFAIAQRVVTNGDYLHFISEGGYERGGLWLADGWRQIQQQNKKMPKYWTKSGSKMEQYTLSGQKPLRLNEPVSHLSFFEADAYARFANARLPSESEWEFASASLSSASGNFLTQGKFHPEAISDENLRMSSKIKGMFGDVWEWTSSLYAPYPGFIASDQKLWKYTGRLEGNKRVVKGGSCLFDGTEFRSTIRKPLSINQDDYCTGIRLVKNL